MINGVVVKNLKVIPDERGRLMEMMRNDDPFYEKFGQIYLSSTYPGVVKGWHFHKKQTDNVVCVRGMIKLVCFDDRDGSQTKGKIDVFFLGDNNNILVKIPAGVYHGWKCVSPDEALVINCPTEVYKYSEPDEFRLDPHNNHIPYNWERKDG